MHAPPPRHLALAALCGLTAACGAAPRASTGPTSMPTAPDAAAEVARLLTGRFDSADQAQRDAEYFDIHLSICPVAAPTLGRHVLYVEQARADKLREPYRQRLYVVEPGPDGAVVSRVFEFSDPAPHVGQCDAAEPGRVEASEVEEKVGCAVTLVREGEAWSGGTHDKGCPSQLRGASYATSTVVLDATQLVSWDRGYDSGDNQVWGAVKGAYFFTRRTTLP